MQKIRIKRIIKEAPENPVPVQQVSFEEDPMNYLLMKYPSLKETLTMLMADGFKDYLNGIYVVAPRPTTFRVVLHNNQEFILTWTGKTYICKVDGKKYYLTFISDKQRATNAIAQLLELGAPIGKPGPEKEEENAPKGPEEEEAPAGEEEAGGGGEEEETLEESVKRTSRVNLKEKKEKTAGEKISGNDAEVIGVHLWNLALEDTPVKKVKKEYQQVYTSLQKIAKDSGTPLKKFSGRKEATTEFWAKETNKTKDEPKTDLISTDGKYRLSSKKGKAQLMSAKIGIESEAKATVLAAARTAGLDAETKETIMRLMGRMPKATKTDKLNTTELEKADPKQLKSKVNIEAKKIFEKADQAQKELQKELDNLFNTNPNFKLAFAYEAMTGVQKFGKQSPAEANYVIAFDEGFTKSKVEPITSMNSKVVKDIANNTAVVVAFKSSSYERAGEKAGYTFFSTIRLMLNDLVSQEQKLEEILNKKELTEDIWSKVKQAFTWIYNQFNKLVDYIEDGVKKVAELFKEGFDKVLEFLELKPTVEFNNDIDFYGAM